MATELVLLGTAGAPMPVPGRMGISSALIVDERVFVVDCGRGSPSAFAEAGLDFTRLEAVFLTHLHADHIGDLPGMLLYPWGVRAGDNGPLSGFSGHSRDAGVVFGGHVCVGRAKHSGARILCDARHDNAGGGGDVAYDSDDSGLLGALAGGATHRIGDGELDWDYAVHDYFVCVAAAENPRRWRARACWIFLQGADCVRGGGRSELGDCAGDGRTFLVVAIFRRVFRFVRGEFGGAIADGAAVNEGRPGGPARAQPPQRLPATRAARRAGPAARPAQPRHTGPGWLHRRGSFVRPRPRYPPAPHTWRWRPRRPPGPGHAQRRDEPP